jgi:hypothetical protein
LRGEGRTTKEGGLQMVVQDEVQFVDEPIFFDQGSGEDGTIAEITARSLANYNQVLERLRSYFVSLCLPLAATAPSSYTLGTGTQDAL